MLQFSILKRVLELFGHPYLLGVMIAFEVFAPVAQAQSVLRGFTVGDQLDGAGIQALGETGANSARFWCRPPVGVAYESGDAFLARVESCLDRWDEVFDYYEAHGVAAIIVLEPPAPMHVAGASPPQHTIFLDLARQQQFIEGWRRVASHLAGHPAVGAFDLMNEPTARKVAGGAMKWPVFAQVLVSTIRGAGADQMIIIESQFGNPVKMSEVGKICKNLLKLGETNIAPSFHFYQPMEYTHQGLYGRRTGVAVPSDKTMKKYYKLYNTAAKGAKLCPQRMYVGEIGASIFASNRAEYFNKVVGPLNSRGWSYSIHAWRESGDGPGGVWDLEPDGPSSDAAPLNALRVLFGIP